MATSRRNSPAAAPRRVIPIKRADGEPLTRSDIQFDFLQAIFTNDREVFTDPYPPNDIDGGKLCFRDLYIKAILHSPKATKALKDKMLESSTFALDFAMLSLLVNVGRINTTMSFFPEMKTTIRTYHPIPPLQRTNGNMQDAPRIKHILKTSLLEDEVKDPPATLADILALCKVGQFPSTSVTNLLFVLSHHTGPIGQAHFQGSLDFLDLFLRGDVSSASRARAFLWICYNYLESPSSHDDDNYDDEDSKPNPFSHSSKTTSPPSFSYLSADAMAQENQTSAEDIAMSQRLTAQRSRIVQSQTEKGSGKVSNKISATGSVADDDDERSNLGVEDVKGKGKRNAIIIPSKGKGKRAAVTKDTITVPPMCEKPPQKEPVAHTLDGGLEEDDDPVNTSVKKRRIVLPASRSGQSSGHAYGSSKHYRYSPYGQTQLASQVKEGFWSHNRDKPQAHTGYQPRNSLQRAWSIILSTDPLVDSEDEVADDQYSRDDYVQRLQVINLSRRHWQLELHTDNSEMDTNST